VEANGPRTGQSSGPLSLNFATWIRDDGQLKIGMPDICND
jgi:hypothetical protein